MTVLKYKHVKPSVTSCGNCGAVLAYVERDVKHRKVKDKRFF